MVLQCIVGCSNYSSLSSSLSHVPRSRNSTFCLATAIPQMLSWLKANHRRATSSRHDNGYLSHLHLLLVLWADAKYGQLDISFPPLHFLFHSIFTTVCSRCVHRHQRLFLHAGCEWKEEALVPVRPVWKLNDKRQNCFLKIRKWGVVKLLLEDSKRKAIHRLLSQSSQSR